ncbi:MAG TPA: hypothetical protein VF439_03450 [Candidatus Paceibacterota bacterium]
MTKHEPASAFTAPPTRNQLLAQVRQTFEKRPAEQFKSIRGIDDMALDTLRAMPVAGTPFEVFAKTLAKYDIHAVPADNTVGTIMAAYDLTKKQIHHIVCYCENGQSISGDKLAKNILSVDAHR